MSDPDAVAGDILDVVHSHAAKLGRFERVNDHEPSNRPGHGLTAALWLDRIDPVPRASGLAVTTARLIVKLRIYSAMEQEPKDAIDPNLSAAAWALIRVLVADLRLGTDPNTTPRREIDVQGAHGVSLFAQGGYLEWDDGGMDRVMDLTIPVVVYDVWPQEEGA
ncbi:MAG TPA: hypothetical protein VGX25_05400 [Actinophytocola sp.]|uniref:hypothetical protein n=1 Tax=Actinophytocola sp. TaxID=1872138 RepID=UPI002DDD13B6|nr:hypothetical protein [Actinophytocola sp.]HEV2778818.1 hypothetical protein [Actinophytocola sp.]